LRTPLHAAARCVVTGALGLSTTTRSREARRSAISAVRVITMSCHDEQVERREELRGSGDVRLDCAGFSPIT
jgi:hypothetical protein